MRSDYGVSRYSITGEGLYRDVYGFISKIESDRNLHMLESLKLNGVEKILEKTKKAVSLVNFAVIMDAYFNPDEDTYDPSIESKFQYKTPPVNPFSPLIKKVIPPNRKGLIEVENAVIEAMSAEMVLIRDKKGRFKSLKVGDEVYLGYLTAVNPEKGEAEFTLNKGGVVEKVILRMFVEN